MSPIETIRSELENLSAAQVADLFLSPYVAAPLLNEATSVQGPSMWIVNRSDVYDETLQSLTLHPIESIATRAKEKLSARHSRLTLLEPPELEGPVEEIPDYMIEDVLGHPLAPFEAMIYFAKSASEDARGSSALSLTRRLLEHPPNWNAGPQAKIALIQAFGKVLLEDPSIFARAYAARVPLYPETMIEEALNRETEDFVRGRLLQNPASTAAMLTFKPNEAQIFTERVRACDARLPLDLRRSLEANLRDPLARALHKYYLDSLARS